MASMCLSCYRPVEDCVCDVVPIDEPMASQPTITLVTPDVASAPPSICTGYIDGIGQIAHSGACPLHGREGGQCTGTIRNGRITHEEGPCALHRYVPGSWTCPQENDWGDDDDTCGSTEATAYFSNVTVTASLDSAYCYMDTSEGVEVGSIEYDDWNMELEIETVNDTATDPDFFMCTNCEAEFYPSDPEYAKLLELYKRGRAEAS